jgi:hypothetical protein
MRVQVSSRAIKGVSMKLDYYRPEFLDAEIPEHMVLLAFNSDSGAYAFDEWWCLKGEELLMEWCLDSESYKDEVIEE